MHQGPGLTNAITGLTEAAKSRTPLMLLAADTPAAQLRSNFKIDQDALVESVGAVAERVHGPATAVADVDARRAARAVVERRAVVLKLPLDVQAAEVELTAPPRRGPSWRPVRPGDLDAAVADAAGARRAARDHRAAAARCCPARARRCGALGELSGAVLATSAVANGLFAGDPFAVGISGGFATPDGAAAARRGRRRRRLRRRAERVDDPPRRAGRATRRSIQVDRDEEAIGAHRPVDLGVVGDARATAEALIAALAARDADLGGAAQRRAGGGDRRRRLARRAVRAEPRLARPARR